VKSKIDQPSPTGSPPLHQHGLGTVQGIYWSCFIPFLDGGALCRASNASHTPSINDIPLVAWFFPFSSSWDLQPFLPRSAGMVSSSGPFPGTSSILLPLFPGYQGISFRFGGDTAVLSLSSFLFFPHGHHPTVRWPHPFFLKKFVFFFPPLPYCIRDCSGRAAGWPPFPLFSHRTILPSLMGVLHGWRRHRHFFSFFLRRHFLFLKARKLILRIPFRLASFLFLRSGSPPFPFSARRFKSAHLSFFLLFCESFGFLLLSFSSMMRGLNQDPGILSFCSRTPFPET